MTTIDTADSRFAKAVVLADQAGQWLKCRTAAGRKAYGIRSSRDPNHVYFVTPTSCDCFDAQHHVCKHSVAVQIHCARVAGKPMPASDVVDGLADMVSQQRPTLTMVRHPDGEISWERSKPTAADYDRIFGRL
jgi:hypothetical protein